MTTIKVSEPTRDRVKAIGGQTRQTAEQVVARALDEYERLLFWSEFSAAAADVAATPPAAEEELAEQRLWDRTTTDGFERG